MKTQRFFYGWIVAVACFTFSLIGVGLGNGTISLYVKPVCDDMGFSRGAYILVYSIISISQMIASLAFGAVYQKLKNVRMIFLIGVLGIASAFTIYCLSRNIYLFYLGAFFQGFGLQYVSAIPLSVVISNWFPAKKGTVLSMVLAGSGLGGVILNPIVGRWISVEGWRVSYFYSSILLLVLLLPALLILREKPSEVGQKAFGSNQGQNQNSIQTGGHLSGPTLSEVRKTPSFLMVLLAAFFFGLSIQPVYVNAAAHLGGVGLNPQVIAWIMSTVFIANTLSKVLLGIVNDRYGIKSVIIINNSFFIIATFFLILTRSNAFGFCFGAGFGIGYTMLSITIPLLIAHLYSGKDYGNIIGIMVAAQTAGYSLGTPLVGFSYDLFHSYNYAFIIAVFLDITGAVLILKALRRAQPRPS